jgi:hypothetical protein
MLHRDSYARRRESLLLHYDLRSVLYLLLEMYFWSPEAIATVTGGTSKVVLFQFFIQIVALQRPRAAVLRWLLLTPPLLWTAMYQARPGHGGVEGWIFRAKADGGWWLLGVGVVYAAVSLVVGLAVATCTDMWSRRVFIRQQLQQQREQQQG